MIRYADKRKRKAGWHKADIVAAVKKAGTNLGKLGKENGFAQSTLRSALHKPHPRAQQLIAATIGVSVHEIWPQWFDRAGNRVSATPPSGRRDQPSTHSRIAAPRQAA